MSDQVEIPSYQELMFPTLRALAELAAPTDKETIDAAVIKLLDLSEAQLSVEFPDESTQVGSKVIHRLAWARSYLKKLDAIENEGRGVWSLTSTGADLLKIGEEEVLHREHELRVGKRPDVFLKRVSQQAESGEGPELSVRELLGEWGVSRRGASVVIRVRRDLAEAGLTTDPPFDTVPLRSAVRLTALQSPSTASEPTIPGGPTGNTGETASESAEVVPIETADTTVTIGTLDSARSGVVSARPDWPVIRAQSLMESHDFSQLAVMTGERSLKGAISWESIARASLYGDSPEFVRDALDPTASIVGSSAPLLEHVGAIADAGFVFVQDDHGKITGIVTASDLSNEFAKMANPFLLLGEIEGWLRQIVDAAFSAEELVAYVDPNDPDRQIEAAASLTFGEYVRLFEDPEAWSQLSLQADRSVLRDHLDDVRLIRNSIMHFSPDPLDEEDMSRIDSLLRWVRLLAGGK